MAGPESGGYGGSSPDTAGEYLSGQTSSRPGCLKVAVEAYFGQATSPESRKGADEVIHDAITPPFSDTSAEMTCQEADCLAGCEVVFTDTSQMQQVEVKPLVTAHGATALDECAELRF